MRLALLLAVGGLVLGVVGGWWVRDLQCRAEPRQGVTFTCPEVRLSCPVPVVKVDAQIPAPVIQRFQEELNRVEDSTHCVSSPAVGLVLDQLRKEAAAAPGADEVPPA